MFWFWFHMNLCIYEKPRVVHALLVLVSSVHENYVPNGRFVKICIHVIDTNNINKNFPYINQEGLFCHLWALNKPYSIHSFFQRTHYLLPYLPCHHSIIHNSKFMNAFRARPVKFISGLRDTFKRLLVYWESFHKLLMDPCHYSSFKRKE